jgi:hypothetical protein
MEVLLRFAGTILRLLFAALQNLEDAPEEPQLPAGFYATICKQLCSSLASLAVVPG